MTDSKTNHWKSLAADLTGIPLEDMKPVEPPADPEESSSSPAVEESFQSVDPTPTDPVIEDSIEVSAKERNSVSENLPARKKKRGSWAFWRSGNKKNKDAGESRVSDDPLAQLNQAETTDDVAFAIDELFSNSAADTQSDEVVFDEDEIATSIDFDEESRSANRDSDSDKSRGRSRGDRNSRRRRDDEDKGGRSRDNSERSRNDRDDGRRRSNDRGDSRSRDSDRRDRNSESENSDRRQRGRRKRNPDRVAIDHGDVPTWDTAVSFVVDNNMVTRDGKSGHKTKSRSRSSKRTRD